jgi:hypothetical protein
MAIKQVKKKMKIQVKNSKIFNKNKCKKISKCFALEG